MSPLEELEVRANKQRRTTTEQSPTSDTQCDYDVSSANISDWPVLLIA
jgi:hypothetical protein